MQQEMAKLSLLLASFALFLLVANASIYRATIEIDEENSSRHHHHQSCQEQIQRQQQLRQCQQHLRQEVQGQQSWDLRGIINPQQQQHHLRQCCQQLQELDNRCRCQGLEQVVRQQLQQGQLRGEEIREAMEIASEIPRRCNIQPRQGCDLNSPYQLSS
ncbi:2S albumin seed storage protein-like [Mangifera indica]|uniref:2S albumin seed storage protein-like n=1 Tax=Mangifera indica TaxID=29780 RepID=UPI001CFA9F2A|nr:2S albumin seed storage protein-like [Mangifera indica]